MKRLLAVMMMMMMMMMVMMIVMIALLKLHPSHMPSRHDTQRHLLLHVAML